MEGGGKEGKEKKKEKKKSEDRMNERSGEGTLIKKKNFPFPEKKIFAIFFFCCRA